MAAALNSDVWQWGWISHDFRGPLPSKWPHKVMEQSKYRSAIRAKQVSISTTACAVLDRECLKMKDKLRDSADSITALYAELGKQRADIAAIEAAERTETEQKSKVGEPDGADNNHLADTVAWLERKKIMFDREIDIHKKNIAACTTQQEHIRSQLKKLMDQSSQLAESQDTYALKVIKAKKGSNEQRQLAEKLQDIKEFAEANQSTRMTLLDQRAETDKDKQNLVHALNQKIQEKENNDNRLRMVQELSGPNDGGDGAPENMMQMLRKMKNAIMAPFEVHSNIRSVTPGGPSPTRPQVTDPLMGEWQKLRDKAAALEAVDEQLRGMSIKFADVPHVGQVTDMLKELASLYQRFADMQSDVLMQDDLDFTSFFKGSRKPGREGFFSSALPG